MGYWEVVQGENTCFLKALNQGETLIRSLYCLFIQRTAMFVITYAVAVARSKIPTGGFTLQLQPLERLLEQNKWKKILSVVWGCT